MRKLINYGVSNGIRLSLRDLRFASESGLNQLRGRNNRPVYLCNSFPKSGTHLLAQILLSLPQVDFWNDIISVQSLSGTMNRPAHIRAKYASAPGGSLIRSHLSFNEDVLQILNERPHYRVMILRDPRDVVVSHAHWAAKERRYFLQPYYAQLNLEERVTASILGVGAGIETGLSTSNPGFAIDFPRWLGWLRDPRTLVVKFEDLVGSAGGGTEGQQRRAIASILKHLGVSDEMALDTGIAALNPSASHTFRAGRIGAWRTTFTARHQELFDVTSGWILRETGYESD